jgi:hypothetical protein
VSQCLPAADRSCCLASLHSRGPCGRQKIQVEVKLSFPFLPRGRRAFLPVSIPLPPCAPPRASVRLVYAPGAILIWSVELGPWTRSTDGQRSDLTTPHSFHHFILSGGRWRRPDATKAPLLARVIPLCRLPKAEQPRQGKGVGEEKRFGFSSSSGFILG